MKVSACPIIKHFKVRTALDKFVEVETALVFLEELNCIAKWIRDKNYKIYFKYEDINWLYQS